MNIKRGSVAKCQNNRLQIYKCHSLVKEDLFILIINKIKYVHNKTMTIMESWLILIVTIKYVLSMSILIVTVKYLYHLTMTLTVTLI